MCQTIWADDGKHIRNTGELAEWLGVDVADITIQEDCDEGTKMEAQDCLCPVDIEYTLDRFDIWHRRDVNGDSMRHFAMKRAKSTSNTA
jgi:hypothetical protein